MKKLGNVTYVKWKMINAHAPYSMFFELKPKLACFTIIYELDFKINK